MKAILLIFPLLMLGLLTYSQKETGTGSDTIFVKGLVDSPYIITRTQFAGLPVNVQPSYKVTDHEGNLKTTLKNVKGFLLKDIIKRAVVTMPMKKRRGEYYVLVTATDGYKVIFSYNELMFSPAGNNSYLLFEADSKPFTDEGPFMAVCTTDNYTGPRHVKWVREIEIRKAD